MTICSKICYDNRFAAGLLHSVRVVRLAHSVSYGGALYAKLLYTYRGAHLALQMYIYAHTCVPYIAIYNNTCSKPMCTTIDSGSVSTYA